MNDQHNEDAKVIGEVLRGMGAVIHQRGTNRLAAHLQASAPTLDDMPRRCPNCNGLMKDHAERVDADPDSGVMKSGEWRGEQCIDCGRNGQGYFESDEEAAEMRRENAFERGRGN